jgi:adenine-specific DNA methylase
MDGWTALAEAVVEAGLSFVNSHPLKAEMSVAAPKSQAKEPIQLDVVLVCRKQTADARKKTDTKVALERSVEHATGKARRLKDCGLTLSANDRRVVLISQFLVEVCAGRSAEQLFDALSSNLTDLDLTAMRLLDSRATPFVDQLKRDETQLALLEKAKASRSPKPAAIQVSRRRIPRRLARSTPRHAPASGAGRIE